MINQAFTYIRKVVFGLGIIFFCILADVLSSGWMIFALFGDSPRWWKIALAKDQSANAALGGSEDETVSSRAYKASLRGDKWGCILCKLLDYVQKDHCKNSVDQ